MDTGAPERPLTGGLCRCGTLRRFQGVGDILWLGPYPEGEMGKSRGTVLAALALGLSLTSCTTDQTAPRDWEGWLSATISGTAESSYRGTGFFHSTTQIPRLPEGWPRYLYLFAAGREASTGQEFTLRSSSEEIPEPGHYSLAWSEGAPLDWYAQYTVIRGDSIDFYSAVEGDLEITAASAERIEGRFTFDAVHSRTCATEWKITESMPDTATVPPCVYSEIAKPAITRINGSFSLANGGLCPREADTEWAAPPWYRSYMIVCMS